MLEMTNNAGVQSDPRSPDLQHHADVLPEDLLQLITFIIHDAFCKVFID